jgi:hypothetical protein
MAVKKIKSEDYLDYIAGLPCSVSGRRPVSCHHESVTRKYSGAFKKYFDFGAIPLTHEIHLYERHEWGKHEFWEKYGLDPVQIVIKLLSDYIELGRDDVELAEDALEMVKLDNGDYS